MDELALARWALLFIVSAAVLVLAGNALARGADEIATRTGWGGLFVGALLVAFATSLPEMVTGIGAVAVGAPDLAVGAIVGSSMTNMALLAILDLAHARKLLASVALEHARVAAVAIGLTALAVVGMATPRGIAVGWIGLETGLIAVAYVVALAWIRRSPQLPSAIPVPIGESAPAAEPRDIRAAVRGAVVASLAILAAGPFVAASARGIAVGSGLGETFVGVAFLALATSLPELTVSFAALRIGAYDLAVGNLFGSNALNMAVLVVIDLAYLDGPILHGAPASQLVAGAAAIGLMALALAALMQHEETRIARLEPDAIVILAAYAGALLAVWGSR